MPSPRLLLILGLPRSGTHLLRFALDKSPEIDFVPETAIFYKYWGSRTLGRLLGRREIAQVIARSIVNSHGDPTMAEFMDREKAIAVAAEAKPSLASTINVLGAFFESPPRYVGEKSPNNTLHIRHLLTESNATDRVRIVVIERNPYDQIASSVRTRHIGGGLIPALARHYLYHRALTDFDAMRIRYEHLVLEPEATLRHLCAQLEVQFVPEMLRPGVLDSSEAENSFQRGDIGFVTDSIGRGRQRLGDEAAALIEAFLSQGPSSLPLTKRLKFELHLALQRRNMLAARVGLVMLKTVVRPWLSRSSKHSIQGRLN